MFEQKPKGNYLKMFLIALIASVGTGIFVFSIMSGYINRNLNIQRSPQLQERTDVPRPQQLSASTGEGVPIAASIAKSATGGVVGISVLKLEREALFDGNAAEKWGVGSGVIVSPDGYILTNHHVAGGKSKRIVVSLADGSNVDGVTLWSDPVLDLAIVKVNAKGLTPIPLGDANALQVGEPAIAIGNPLGLQFQRTVTSGIISALNRTIKIDTEQGVNYMEDLIQTDASINPGNSGGPLVNSRGEVVGINTIKVASAEAIGFAIPINVAVPIIKQFVQRGEFSEPYIGVFAYDKEVIPFVDGNLKIDTGIYVAEVDESGPAYNNGIRLGCIIKEVDGVKIDTMMQLRTHIYSKRPGDTINVTHVAEETGEIITVPIKLAAKEKDGLLTR